MEGHNSYDEITPEIIRLAKLSEEAGVIDTELFTKYDVKSGSLRRQTLLPRI